MDIASLHSWAVQTVVNGDSDLYTILFFSFVTHHHGFLLLKLKGWHFLGTAAGRYSLRGNSRFLKPILSPNESIFTSHSGVHKNVGGDCIAVSDSQLDQQYDERHNVLVKLRKERLPVLAFDRGTDVDVGLGAAKDEDHSKLFLRPENQPLSLRKLANIIEDDLCHRCGSCVGICPTGVLGVDEDEYPVVNKLLSCTDCDLCTKVCPGVEFDVSATAAQLFGFTPSIDSSHGHFLEAYLISANDRTIRSMSASGGFVTAFLIWLLEEKIITGSVGVTADEHVAWKGKPVILKTRDDVLRASSSKYAIAPTNIALEQVKKNPGKYAFVGLPCQIHGLHKSQAISPSLRSRIGLSISLFCHAAIEHEPMQLIWSELEKDGVQAKRYLSRVGKHPGTPFIEQEDKSLHRLFFPWAKDGVYVPNSTEILNMFYRLYTPMRCMTCFDATGETADISVGDPWMPSPSPEIDLKDGYSFVLVRTERAKELIRKAAEHGVISVIPLQREQALNANHIMTREKKDRAFYLIRRNQARSLPTPSYNSEVPVVEGMALWRVKAGLVTHLPCFWHQGPLARLRVMLFRLALSPVGYFLLWCNNIRRQLLGR